MSPEIRIGTQQSPLPLRILKAKCYYPILKNDETKVQYIQLLVKIAIIQTQCKWLSQNHFHYNAYFLSYIATK
jgi:hypothetical protein